MNNDPNGIPLTGFQQNGNAYAQGPPTNGNAYAQGPPTYGNAYAQGPPTNGNAYAQGPPTNGSAPPQATPSRSKLRRALTERQINMIAFSGVVGTGLFLNTGTIIREVGPGGALLGYFIGALIYWSVIATLGEITAVLPVEGILIEFPSRFLGRHIGFAVGWLYWACYVVILPSQLIEIARTMEFAYSTSIRWKFAQRVEDEVDGGSYIPRAVWIILLWVLVLPVNLIPTKIYGKMEAIVGYFKLLVLCGLILLMIIIADGRATPGDRKGFSASWKSPKGLHLDPYVSGDNKITGPAAEFLSIVKVLSTALFSFVGMEVVAVAIGEAKDTNKAKSPESIKVGTRKIYIRVILLYLASIVAVSFPVRSNDPELLRDVNGFQKNDSGTSPFIIAVVEAGIPTLPHILNAFFVFSGFASAVNSLYVSSRTLYSLAMRDMVWPKWFQKRLTVTCRLKSFEGVPATAIGTGWAIGLLACAGIKNEPGEVFKKFSTNAVVSAQIVNCCICLAYIRYYRHLRVLEKQISDPNLLRESNSLYAYKSHFQPLRACFGFIGCAVVIVTNGLPSILKKPVCDIGGIVASYISVFLFAVLAIFYALNRSYRATKIQLGEVQYRQHEGDRRGDFHLDSSVGVGKNLKAIGKWVLVYL